VVAIPTEAVVGIQIEAVITEIQITGEVVVADVAAPLLAVEDEVVAVDIMAASAPNRIRV